MYRNNMESRRHMDEKLELSCPSRELLEELADKCAQNPDPDNTFQYAFALSKSRNDRSELRYAINVLDSLVKQGYSHQTDCTYGSAVAHYLLEEYDETKSRCEALLRARPDNTPAAELHGAAMAAKGEEDERRVKKVVVSGTVAVAAVALAMLIGGKKR